MSDSAVVETSASPVAAAPAVEKKAKKTVTKAKKISGAPTHPPTQQMVDAAIKTLKERGGSSLPAIKKYLTGTYKVDAQKLAPFIKKYLKSAVTSGKLIQTKGKGASGSFKLSPGASKEPKAKKPTVEKKKKAVAAVGDKKKKAAVAAATKKAAPAVRKSSAAKKTAEKKKTEKAKAKTAKKTGTVKAKPAKKAPATKPKAPKAKSATAAKPKKAAAQAKKPAAKKTAAKK